MSSYKGLLDFISHFPTDQACKAHLAALKWHRGYTCKKCGHTTSVKGATAHHRRCQRCGYDESPTANTLFHKVKFPLVKAFTIVYQLTTMKKGMSSAEIARQHNIHQETAWYFKQKVMRAMAASQTAPLNGLVEVDETTIGGYEKGKPGRSQSKKKKVQIAVEIDYPEGKGAPKIRRADARLINSYTADELGRVIDEMVDKQALISTDGLRAYQKAVGQRDHLVWPSEQGTNFEKLHWMIFNLKNWLRGIHHKISNEHARYYLSEFFFRFNNRNWIDKCADRVIKLMVKLPWMPYKQLIAA